MSAVPAIAHQATLLVAPAPWRTFRSMPFYVFSADGLVVCHAKNPAIASQISALPALLAAAQRALALLEDPAGDEIAAAKVEDELRAALAKAAA